MGWRISIQFPVAAISILLCLYGLTPAYASALATYKEGMILVEQGRLREAEPILEEAVKLGRLELDPGGAEFQRILTDLANVYGYTGRYDDAKWLLDEAVAIGLYPKLKGRPETVLSLSMRGHLATLIDHPAKGEEFIQHAIEVAESIFEPTDPRLAHPLSMLGVIHTKHQRCREARPVILKSIRLIANADDTFRVERAKRHYAAMYHYERCSWISPGWSGRHDAKLEQHFTAIEKLLPSNHPVLAQAYGLLGGVYHTEGNLDDAERLLIRAKAAGEHSMGPRWRYINYVRARLHDVHFERVLANKPGSRVGAGTGCSPVLEAIDKLATAERFRLSIEYFDRDDWTTELDERVLLKWKVRGRQQREAQAVIAKSVHPLSLLDAADISICSHEGEDMGGTTIKYLIERDQGDGKERVLMWVDAETGLPVQALFRSLDPQINAEAMARYSYRPEIDSQ